jgi:hypothetical protein
VTLFSGLNLSAFDMSVTVLKYVGEIPSAGVANIDISTVEGNISPAMNATQTSP